MHIYFKILKVLASLKVFTSYFLFPPASPIPASACGACYAAGCPRRWSHRRGSPRLSLTVVKNIKHVEMMNVWVSSGCCFCLCLCYCGCCGCGCGCCCCCCCCCLLLLLLFWLLWKFWQEEICKKNYLDSFSTKTILEHMFCTHFIVQTQRQDVHKLVVESGDVLFRFCPHATIYPCWGIPMDSWDSSHPTLTTNRPVDDTVSQLCRRKVHIYILQKNALSQNLANQFLYLLKKLLYVPFLSIIKGKTGNRDHTYSFIPMSYYPGGSGPHLNGGVARPPGATLASFVLHP